MTATKNTLIHRLAHHRASRYPAVYEGHLDSAIVFVRKAYTTKASALTACLNFGLAIR